MRKFCACAADLFVYFVALIHRLEIMSSRGCPKAYHPACIKRDEAFFKSKAKWNCGLLRTSKMLMVRQLALLNSRLFNTKTHILRVFQRRKILIIDGLCKKMGYKDAKLLMLFGL
ncbi:uncharacterized protein [Gossypium hirsutum]|uniref:Zinc finger PHD-type domain-containing protein n=1 Tax=Gossypium hirsutum TaxID=3635 RepID=A0A1U8KEU2_GOSHI|nr:uncharacterized protein LOC107916271 [Gossypium hirsutum]